MRKAREFYAHGWNETLIALGGLVVTGTGWAIMKWAGAWVTVKVILLHCFS